MAGTLPPPPPLPLHLTSLHLSIAHCFTANYQTALEDASATAYVKTEVVPAVCRARRQLGAHSLVVKLADTTVYHTVYHTVYTAFVFARTERQTDGKGVHGQTGGPNRWLVNSMPGLCQFVHAPRSAPCSASFPFDSADTATSWALTLHAGVASGKRQERDDGLDRLPRERLPPQSACAGAAA